MTATILAAILAAILFPVIFILWLSESKQERAKRLRKSGHTYKQIAAIIGCKSPSTARKYAMA